MLMNESNSEIKRNFGPIFNGHKICQQFIAKEDGLRAISLWIATYREKVKCTATLTIFDEKREKILRQISCDTSLFQDNAWQMFSFESLDRTKDRMFWLCFETDGPQEMPLTLWADPNNHKLCLKNGIACEDAVAFRETYTEGVWDIMDKLLFSEAQFAPNLPHEIKKKLDEILFSSIDYNAHTILRTIHLVAALGKSNNVQNVLSIGCGQALQEAFIAGRLPDIRVNATDLSLHNLSFQLSNLSFHQADILTWSEQENYDFVFSIECLEHIKDYNLAFANMAAKVKKGKYLYISVPFANNEEQKNERLIREEWEQHEHYLPGFDYELLQALFASNGFEVIHESNMFYSDVSPVLNALTSKLGKDTLQLVLRDIAALYLLDLKEERVDNRAQAVGIFMLGRKRI